MTGEAPIQNICIYCHLLPWMDEDYKCCWVCFDKGRELAEKVLASPPLANYAEEQN